MEIFADNTKYLFLHMTNHHRDVQAIWIAKDEKLAKILRDRGFTSHSQTSLQGIWYALRAGTTIIDAFLQPINFRWTGRTRLVQLLHGKGMKKGGYMQKPLRKQDYIFSTSPFVSGMLPSLFTQESKVEIAGYSRGDVLFKNISGSDIGTYAPTIDKVEDSQYEKIFLYAPTFRRGVKSLDIESILDLQNMSSWLKEHSYLLLVSLHPKYSDQARELSYQNIHFVEDSDIYPLLSSIDILIADYGSTFTDYLLLDRPIIFYPYDLEEYDKNEGFSFVNYDEHTPGVKAYSSDELVPTIESVLVKDNFSEDRKRVRTLYHTYPDGNSSERIAKTLLDI